MEIHYMDITTVVEGIIGHVVNCQGVMGSGVAKAISDIHPKVKQQFLQQPTGKGMMGVCDIVKITPLLSVANIYGQLYYGNDGRRYGDPEAVMMGLEQLLRYAIHNGIEDVYLPYKMACNRAGLDWEREICPIITELANANPLVTVNICIHGE